jgi:hypothetical protein
LDKTGKPIIEKPLPKGFSKGEVDLYREVRHIRAREAAEEEALEEKRKTFYESKKYVGIPVPTKKAENRQKFGQNIEDKLDEWEKNQVRMLYKDLDADKKAALSVEDLMSLIQQLREDKAIIGKVPA